MSNASQFADTIATFEAQLREIYNRGRRDERERIERILRTASDELLSPVIAALCESDAHAPKARGARATRRVAHGTIRPLVQKILQAEPGLTKAEIARRVAEQNSDIAPSSIANELQRNENIRKNKLWLYRRKRDRWFLLEDDLPKETAGIAEDDHPPELNVNTGNGYDRSTMNPSGSA